MKTVSAMQITEYDVARALYEPAYDYWVEKYGREKAKELFQKLYLPDCKYTTDEIKALGDKIVQFQRVLNQ